MGGLDCPVRDTPGASNFETWMGDAAGHEPSTCKSAVDIGNALRAERKRQRLSLERLSGLANVSMRFLSEVERGKPTAELGKVLKVLATLGLEVDVRSRASTAPVQGLARRERNGGD